MTWKRKRLVNEGAIASIAAWSDLPAPSLHWCQTVADNELMASTKLKAILENSAGFPRDFWVLLEVGLTANRISGTRIIDYSIYPKSEQQTDRGYGKIAELLLS